ncbi:MAG: hypothetical protein K9N51_11730, partial [Candidatus Pacebacteria bacterium]|nr:hypothetical protein [Candidatus Paceibacterota bacterium]
MTRTSFKPRPGFVTEGLFIAFPLSMPEDGLPIPPDEAYISTLCLSADGQRIYGATRGDRCHCFVSMHKGAVGGILDVGTIAEATHVIVLVEGDTRKQNKHSFTQLFAVGETPDGTGCWEMSCPRFVNTIQEPSYPRPRVDKKSFVSGWRGIAGGVVLGRDSILCVCRN